MKQLIISIFSAALSLIFITAEQAQDQPPAAGKPPAAAIPGKPVTSSPKSYNEIITGKAQTRKGLLTVHKVEEKYYFEIPDSLLGREILAVTRFSKTAGGSSLYGGEIANQQTIEFEKGPSHTVFVRVRTLISQADSTNDIFKAVVNSNLDPIVAAFPVAAYTRDSSGVVVDITDFFKGDNQPVSINLSIKKRFLLGGLLADRSYIQSIHTYPINTEIRTVKTFSSTVSDQLAFGTGYFPVAKETGVVTLELNTSLLLLPATPMQRRYFDPRVGYFADAYTVYSDEQEKVDERKFIVRWRLEPRPEDREKYLRGELVNPAKPILYYIDPATPKKWRPYLIAGINDWQKAFEKAGFKNAILAKEWPVDDTTMSLEDARFSVLRYFASPITNAYGPNVHDPRSGEILESHIGWYHNVMELVHDWYMTQCAALDPRARTMKFDDSLMGQLIRFVSSHEIGHTLGLRHNFGSSSQTPVEKLRDRRWLDEHGHTASIMDYARFDYVAQPEDSIPEYDLFPRIGEYDKWAIQWGYRLTGLKDADTESKLTNRWVVDSLKANPRLWFAGEGQEVRDPRVQTEDLGDNAMKAGEYGIRNLQRVLAHLPEWTREEGDEYEHLNHMYIQVAGQYTRYVNHVLRNVGGTYATRKSVEQEGKVYVPTPKAIQKEAIAFLNKNVFTPPLWLLNKNIANTIRYPLGGTIFTTISRTMHSLLVQSADGALLALEANQDRFPDADNYTVEEMLNDLQKGVFAELATKAPVTTYRRVAQKEYVKELIAYTRLLVPLGGEGSGVSLDYSASDVPTIVRAQLINLKKEIDAAIPAVRDRTSLEHWQDLSQRIRKALDPK